MNRILDQVHSSCPTSDSPVTSVHSMDSGLFSLQFRSNALTATPWINIEAIKQLLVFPGTLRRAQRGLSRGKLDGAIPTSNSIQLTRLTLEVSQIPSEDDSAVISIYQEAIKSLTGKYLTQLCSHKLRSPSRLDTDMDRLLLL